MGRFRFTPLAKQDLKDITRFIALEYPDAARRFVVSVKQQCQTLSDFPEMGQLWQELDQPLRSFPVGNYLIFYRPAGAKAIEVIAVVSGFRDLEMFFEQRLGKLKALKLPLNPPRDRHQHIRQRFPVNHPTQTRRHQKPFITAACSRTDSRPNETQTS